MFLLLAGSFLAGSFFFFSFYGNYSKTEEKVFKSKKETLSSFFNSRKNYEEAFSSVGEIEKKEIEAGIISHHFLAKNLIAKFFSGIKNENIENVLLVGPDHFGAIKDNDVSAYTSNLIWTTPFGELQPNNNLIDGIINKTNVKINDLAFRQEHSIYVLVPFVKKFFPNAKIIPLILRNNNDLNNFNDFGIKLRDIVREKTLIIVSSDFSHNMSVDQAKNNDEKSIVNLKSLSPDTISKVTCDCNNCIATMLGFLGTGGKNNFYLVENKNSSDFGGGNTNVTSYVSGYYLTETKKAGGNFSLLFAGDAMLDRQIRTIYEKKGASFLTEKIEHFFKEADEVVFNLEGPVTKNKSVSQNTVFGERGHMSFTFDQNTTKDFLKNTRASVVFLGNNHILNFGQEGLIETENFLKENKVGYFGDIKGKSEPLMKEITGKKVAYVAFNQFLGENAQSVSGTIRQLKKNNDFVVLYAHWGTEYAQKENEQQIEWAHSFIDAGADLVIGSHPHVVEPIETYKNKIIFYSLGNFVFDQYFSPETIKGLAIEVSVKNNVLDFYLSPLSLNYDGSTTLLEGKKKDDLLLWLAENSFIPESLKEGLKSGHFQIEKK